jgi:hypothetical protein
MSEAATQWTRQSFRAALGQALAEIHKSNQLGRDLRRVLMDYDIPAPKVSSGDTLAFEIPPQDPDEVVGRGVKWSDLSAGAQARLGADRVRKERQLVYKQLVQEVQYGTYTADVVTAHFGALGFPLPTESTTIAACVTMPDGNREVVNFTVPRKVTEEEARTALAAQAGTHPRTGMIRAAFSDAENLPEPVSDLSVRTRQVWAPADTIS